MKDYIENKKCLLCKNELQQIYDICETPLANEFLSEEEFVSTCKNNQKQNLFPLNIMKCVKCNHVQLGILVNESRMYENYLYESGTSKSTIDYFRQYAEEIVTDFFPNVGSGAAEDLILEVASNDGTFLSQFKAMGKQICAIGIDPAQNLAKTTYEKHGFVTVPEFFNKDSLMSLEQHLLKRKAKVIVMNNAFAHNADLASIVEAVKYCLDENGTFIIENSYLLDILKNNLIDLFYHEHIHHHHIDALQKFFNKFDMEIYKVKHVDRHGGSFRAYICKKNSINKPKKDESVANFIKSEKNINILINNFIENINYVRNNFNNNMNRLTATDTKISIYGYPAKATTLWHWLRVPVNGGKIGYDIYCKDVADDALLKINKYPPGNIFSKIMSPKKMFDAKPDYVLILGWNFAKFIIKDNKSYVEHGGTFIIPFPQYEEITKDNIDNYLKE